MLFVALMNHVHLRALLLFAVLRADKKLPENVEDFLQLSKDTSTMKLFLESFVSCVVGRMKWRNLCHEQRISKIATATDEAFALLVLENIWDAWKEVDPQEYIMARSKRRREEDDEDEVVEANSNDGKSKRRRRKEIAGQYTKEHRNAKRYRGWGEDGHARFNQLVNLVREDRKVRALFEEEYLDKKKRG